jgi:DNA modification methylase
MSLPKVVDVRCKGSDAFELESLIEFQGTLKELSVKDYEKFKMQLCELGFSEPVSVWVNNGNNYILNGHTRIKTLKKMKTEGFIIPDKIPVSLIDAKDWKQAKKKVLALTSQYGKITNDGLYEFLSDANLDFDEISEEMRFPEIDFDKYALEFLDQEVVEDEVPEVPLEPKSKHGDIYKLGDHLLYCGDLKTLELNFQADLLVTDPPYGVSYASKNKMLNALNKGNRIQKAIENDHKTSDEMFDLWKLWFAKIKTCLKGGASYYITGPQGGDLLLLLLQSIKETGFTLKHMLIWKKNNHVLGRCDYHYKHEPIIYGWINDHKFYGGRSETSVWEINKPHKSDLHPTMKPVELYARAIKNSSKEGDLVFDAFGGSGTCLIACEHLKRKAVLTEIDPAYCDVIVERWEILTGKKSELIEQAKT